TQHRADAIVVAVDRAERERQHRAEELEEASIHDLVLRGARREPVEIAYVLVERHFSIVRLVDIAGGREQGPLDDAAHRTLVDAGQTGGCDARGVVRSRDAVHVAERTHWISSESSMMTSRGPSSGSDESCAWADAFLCSRISRRRASSSTSRSRNSASGMRPSS